MDVDEKEKKSCTGLQAWDNMNRVVKIYAIHDYYDYLVHIKFDNNLHIPRVVMKLLSMIVKFHPYLTGVTINKGCNAPIIYELCKCLPLSNITDVCLDNTFISEANYHILLEDHNNLRQISLARCRLEDEVIKNIASKLIHPLPASKTLSILNLASNRITDQGCKELGNALRSNRQINYLNLADNAITDVGAELILNSLEKFPMTSDEIIAGKKRHMSYFKEKNELVNRMIVELRDSEFDKRSTKSIRSASMTPQKKSKMEKEPSLKTVSDGKSLANLAAILYEKAVVIAENVLGEYQDPFSLDNTATIDGIVYCLGNNTLCYLNLAYNNVSYFTLKKLLKVVLSQKSLNRTPAGLVNVCIEGNQLPDTCLELKQLDEILEIGLITHSKSLLAFGKKKTGTKSVR